MTDYEKINNCCGEKPSVLQCDCDPREFCNCIEKIECYICGRIIYGRDKNSKKEWNDGKSD